MVKNLYSFYPISTLPKPLDLVWCHFPLWEEPNTPAKPRPALVRQTMVRWGELPYIEVVYGTTNLKFGDGIDFFHVSNVSDQNIAGLPHPTRFCLDRMKLLPWAEEWFTNRDNEHSPIIGKLSLNSIIRLKLHLEAMQRRSR